MGRGLLTGVLGLLLFVPSASGYNEHWGCFQRQADGQCVVTVSIAQSFPELDKQVIREVLANFSQSPNIEAVEAQGGTADVKIVVGKYKGVEGFFTDLHTRTTYIPKGWFYVVQDPPNDLHDGNRGVYCHEFMHSIAGAQDWEVPLRTQPSCFNGTSPYLGVEDFEAIAATYPLP